MYWQIMARKNNSKAVQTNLTTTQKKKMNARWRKLGYFSASDYLRDLIRSDLKKK